MRKFIFVITITMLTTALFAQTYIMPKNGSLYYKTCSGYIFDSGDQDGNYTDNEEGYITVDPVSSDQVMQLTVEQLELDNYGDYLFLNYNDDYSFTNDRTNVKNGETVLSNNEFGGVIVAFSSDDVVNDAGFRIAIGCLTVYDVPDLSLSGTTVLDNDIVPGEVVKISTTVFSDGRNEINDTIIIDYYLNDENNIATANLILSDTIFSIQKGDNIFETSAQLPADIQSGSFYLFSTIDALNTLVERDDNNNTCLDTISIFDANVDLKLTGSGYDYFISGKSYYLGRLTSIGNTVCDSFSMEAFLSEDKIIDGNDIELEVDMGIDQYGSATYELDLYFSIPEATSVADSIYYLIAGVKSKCPIAEKDTTNNYFYQQVLNREPDLDLILNKFTVPGTLVTNENYDFNFAVSYKGNYTTNKVYYSLFISNDETLDESDSLLLNSYIYYYYNSYNYGEGTFTYNTPDSIGDYNILLVLDPDNLIQESDESNNIFVKPVHIDTAKRDFSVSNSTYTYNADYGTYSVRSCYNSLGNTSAVYYWGSSSVKSIVSGYYLSSDSILDTNDLYLDEEYITMSDPGAEVIDYKSLDISADVSDKYLIVKSDYKNSVNELNEDNNIDVVKLYPPIITQSSDDFVFCSSKKLFTDSALVRDNGGKSYYATSSNDTLIVMPQTTGKRTRLKILSFDIDYASTFDVYAGDISESSELDLLASVEDDLGQSFVSTDSTGALTIIFKSGKDFVRKGFDLFFDTVSASEVAYQVDIEVKGLSLNQEEYKPGYNANCTVISNIYGFGLSSSFKYGIYLSSDPQLDTTDLELSPNYSSNYYNDGNNYEATTKIYFSIPSKIEPGEYYLFVKADIENSIDEGSENNNLITKKFEILPSEIDFLPLVFQIDRGFFFNEEYSQDFQIHVLKTGSSYSGYVGCNLYLSTDNSLDSNDILLDYNTRSYSGSTDNIGIYFNLEMTDSIPAGIYYLIGWINPDMEISETDTTNNIISIPFVVIEDQCDFMFTSLDVPITMVTENSYSIGFSFMNIGKTLSNGYEMNYYLSDDPILDTSDIVIYSEGGAYYVPINYEITKDFTYELIDADPGVKYIIGTISNTSDLDTTNNIIAEPFEIVYQDNDVSITELYVSDKMINYDNMNNSVEYKICNNLDNTTGLNDIEIFISKDNKLDESDSLVYTTQRSLGSYYCKEISETLDLSVISEPGEYYIIARVVNYNDINLEDNIAITPITIEAAYIDLYISDFALDNYINPVVPDVLISGSYMGGNFGNVTSTGSYVDFYLSTDAKLDDSDTVAAHFYIGNISGLEARDKSFSFYTPSTTTDKHIYLIGKIDKSSIVPETNSHNNLVYCRIDQPTSSIYNEPLTDKNMMVYPNPFIDMVCIEFAEVNLYHLVVTDYLGRTVVNKEINGNTFILDLSHLLRGVYFLKTLNVKTKEPIGTHKIIKY